MTPFENELDAKKDFLKVFSSKTGNDFTTLSTVPFEKKKGKYQLITLKKESVDLTEHLKPIDYDKLTVQSKIPKTMRDIMHKFTDV